MRFNKTSKVWVPLSKENALLMHISLRKYEVNIFSESPMNKEYVYAIFMLVR